MSRTNDGPGARLAYIDSNVFIHFYEGEPALAEWARRLLLASRAPRRVFVTSELTLAEVLAPTLARGPISAERKRDYLELIVQNAAIEVVPVSRAILLHTTELRSTSRHKLPDAVHCATAALSRCRFIVSRDRQMQRLPGGIEWVDLSEAGVRMLLEVMRA